ncbi:DUF3168 domain-containing protein [Devosia sp. RR2S18]|uniref:DUF3168 domain-containing protein n=1 Tax=Devosia rhizosphaerae TaxID=3049774 RepID=UPI00254125CA|nr:DUF3168 domain-containing protein [Devosia sp. RR2S18]WIJ24229.1 DUF3168 domain-containing protein [Devosia sp. RR2S18]
MTEPSLALQTAIRNRLIASPHVMELVDPHEIRDGNTRPEAFPSIILGAGQVEVAGHYRNYRNVTCYLDLHIWAEGEGLEGAKTIGGAVWNAIGRELSVPGFDLHDGIRVERSIYMRDPSGWAHGVISLRAQMGKFL